MANDHKSRIREEQERAAWYGVAQVEDQNFVHHKSSPFGRNFEGDCADIVVPLQPEDTGVKENHTALRLIGKIILRCVCMSFQPHRIYIILNDIAKIESEPQHAHQKHWRYILHF